MGSCLVFAGEVQINIRHLVAAESQEGLKGDVKAVLFHLRATNRADRVGKVRAAVELLGDLQNGMLAIRIGAAVVGRERINFRDTRQISNDTISSGGFSPYNRWNLP